LEKKIKNSCNSFITRDIKPFHMQLSYNTQH